MLEKIIEQVKPHTALKKVCIFFLVFAAALTVMGISHDILYGSSGQAAPEKARTAQKTVISQENEIRSIPAFGGLTEQEFADSFTLLAASKTTKLEEISSTSEDKKNSVKIESKLEDEEDADDEANAGEAEVKKKKTEASGTKTEEAEETPDKATKSKKISDAESSGFVYSKKIPMSRELQEFTYQKCKERELEYELVLAIIWRESRFNENAVHVNANGTRDNGMMQINDINRKWLRDNYGITDLMDPFQNIDAGTAMLGNLTSKYGSHNAMLAYQYGEGGMAKKLNQGITTSTAIEKAYEQRDYYRKII